MPKTPQEPSRTSSISQLKKPSELSKSDWEKLYPRFTLREIAAQFQCGETTVYKWVKRAGLVMTKAHRVERNEDHKHKLSLALLGREGARLGKQLTCLNCSKDFYVKRSRLKIAKFCSPHCRAAAIQKNWTGEKNPRFIQGVTRSKLCVGCGTLMVHTPPKSITSFELQKFCTKECADRCGLRYRGENHPSYKGQDSRRRSRSHQDSRWAIKVLQRDLYVCQRCGISGEVATLQAHHIKPYELFKSGRNDVSNGITLCSKCHWHVHDTLDPQFIDIYQLSRKVSPPKPLLVDGSVSESKVFGKDSRKWRGECYWCGCSLVKRLSDVTGRNSVFCGKSCAMKHRRAFGTFRPTDPALIPNTARGPERAGINPAAKHQTAMRE